MQPRLIKILKAKKPTHIAVADKPLLLGGQVENITIAEFERRTGIHYDESMYIDASLKINELNLGNFFSAKNSRSSN
jgi:hypothetical protein